jgi:hypothetical protein
MELESGAFFTNLYNLYGYKYVWNWIRDKYYLEYTQVAFRYY